MRILTLMEAPDETFERVSVVMPVRNEARHVTATLEALAGQSYPSSCMEIIVVDGRSEDDTRALVTAFAGRHPECRVRLIDNPERSIPTAMNYGIAAASGSVIVRMDGHTLPAPDYVASCIAALARSGAGAVGGCISPVGGTPFGSAVAIAQSSGLGAGDAAFHFATEPQFTDTVYLGAFPRSVLERVGGYDPALLRNEDYELCLRIRAAGWRVYLDPAIRSRYVPRGSPAALARQYAAYGWWKVETWRRHPRSLRWRQAVPAAFVVTLLGSALLAPVWVGARVTLAATMVAYLAAHVVAGVVMRRAGRFAPSAGDTPTRVRDTLVLQARTHVAMAVLHVAWGGGFIANAVRGGRMPHKT